MDAGAAFWIFLAVVIGVGAWASARKEAEKHETLRRLLDQGGALNESQLRELLRSFEKPLGGQPGMPVYTPPNPRRQCVVIGGIIACIGVAITVFFGLFYVIFSNLRPDLSPDDVGTVAGILVGAAVGASVVVLGAGIALLGRLFPAVPKTAPTPDAVAGATNGADALSSATSDAQGRFTR